MNEERRYEDMEYEVGVLKRRIGNLWGAIGLLLILAVALMGWNTVLMRDDHQARATIDSTRAMVDTLRSVQATAAQASTDLEARIAPLETLGDRIAARATRGSVSALDAKLAALNQRVNGEQARLDATANDVRQLSAGLTSVGDSIAVVRDLVHAQDLPRLAALEQATAGNGERLAALDTKIDALGQSQRRNKWYSAAGDALGIVNLGVIVPHVLDHAGR